MECSGHFIFELYSLSTHSDNKINGLATFIILCSVHRLTSHNDVKKNKWKKNEKICKKK